MTEPKNPEATDSHQDEVDKILELQKSDPIRAFESLKDLSPRSVPAMLLLGWTYEHGVGTAADKEAAETCYRRAAKGGSSKAAYNLGVLSADRGDYQEALTLYAQAAELGEPEAQQARDRLQEWLDVRDALENARTQPGETHQTFLNLAQQGSVLAMANLAWTYAIGCGTDIDSSAAEYWYLQAYDKGSGDIKAQAAYSLGKIYQGRGYYTRAREMYQYGCDQGLAEAIRRLGDIYAGGLGIERDRHKARALYEQAARIGDRSAFWRLARLDLSGGFGSINLIRGIARLVQAPWRISATLGSLRGQQVITAQVERHARIVPDTKQPYEPPSPPIPLGENIENKGLFGS